MPYFTHGDTRTRLLILFFFNNLDIDGTADQAYRCLYDLNLTNYFEFCDNMAELKEQSYLAEVPRAFGQTCKITVLGTQALEFFEQSVPQSQRSAILNYIQTNHQRLLRETQVSSTIEKADEGGYRLRLSVSEGIGAILDIRMLIASEELAMDLRKNWDSKSEDIYNYIFDSLQSKR